MNDYYLKFITNKNIGSEEFATLLLNEWYYEFDEKLRPERFGYGEPIRYPIAEYGLNAVIAKWPVQLKRISHPKYDIDVNWRPQKGLDEREFPWACTIWLKKRAEDALTIKLFEFIVRYFEPAFGLVTTEAHNEEKNRIKCKSKILGCLTKEYYIGMDITDTLPGIYWLTYFNNKIIDRIGCDKFNSLMPFKRWNYHDGIIIQAYDKCFDVNAVAEEEIVKHLGEKMFFDKTKYIAEHNLEIVE